jgi:hypothetical protein
MMTFGHIMRLIDNPYLAGLVSFLASVGVPVQVYQLILKDNSRLASWFGLRQPDRSKIEGKVETESESNI